MSVLRLGMVGGGQGAFIGPVHLMAARLDRRFELVAGALSSDPERAVASAPALGIASERAYTSFAEMAKKEAERDDGIDAVAIVTPNHVHHAAAKAFLEAGVHVICDKPLTTSVVLASELVDLARSTGLVFAVTYNYSGYPMVRQAREMVRGGELGALRLVQVEYAQDWLTTPLEESGQKQAAWRTDPQRSGPAGSLGDIGTHAFHLACFVTGLTAKELLAELHTFVPGRRLDDNAHILLRFAGGARGMLWASQVAPGNENGLRLRVYGEKGGLEWSQEDPNRLVFSPFGEPPRTVTRSGAGAGETAARASRIPAGHPEGYLEAFAQVYKDAADWIEALKDGRPRTGDAGLVPDVLDGLHGVRFVEAAVRSNAAGSVWVSLS